MSAQSAVRDLLREHGPLTIDELVALVMDQGGVVTKNPKQTIRHAVAAEPMIEPGTDCRYVYFPRFIAGACVRLPVDRSAPDGELLAITPGASALLWPARSYSTSGITPHIAMERGPTIQVESGLRWPDQVQTLVRVPDQFWRWWAEQPEVAALLLCCVDGEAGRYSARSVAEGESQREEAAARDVEIMEAAAAVMHRTRSIQIVELARRLLARGIYHHGPAPNPIVDVLFQPGSPFIREIRGIVYRPDITPAMQRLFQHRLDAGLADQQAMMLMAREQLFGSADEEEPGEEVELLGHEAQQEELWPEPLPLPPGAEQQGYRLRVRLRWMPKVWREVEMPGDHTLENLHSIIHRAFEWDNDHLYAFYLSGKRGDTLTEVGAPTNFGDEEPPLTSEVALAHLELKRGQKFLYLFDFGDNLEHDIEYLSAFKPERTTTYPRVTEVHGEAPAQYPAWDE